MRKLRCRKALSPVVAAIILIAVTVAVSIAVAAWMGALTITFMATEEISITSMTFEDTSNTTNNTIDLVVKNTGTGAVTITEVKVNDVPLPFTSFVGSDETGTYEPGEEGKITINMGTSPWKAGNKYRVMLLSSTGKTVATYEKVAS